jgi:hypothetical protein
MLLQDPAAWSSAVKEANMSGYGSAGKFFYYVLIIFLTLNLMT